MLGWTEWLVILLIVVLLFGARKLPELAHSMGTSIQAFKKGMRDNADGGSQSSAATGAADRDTKPTPNGHH